MKQENLYNETEIRRFLLGEFKEKERTALEEKFLADEDFFVQIQAAEDDLIEDYVRGNLKEKEKFEREFLTTKKRRERVAFTRVMIAKLNETAKKTEVVSEKMSFFASLIEFFRQPKFAFGAAFSILALVFGFWFLAVRKPVEIVQQITPMPTLQPIVNQATAVNQNVAVNQNTNITVNSNLPEKHETNKANSNIEKPKKTEEKPKETVVNPVLALFAGGVRSDGKTNELNLPKSSQGASLVLNLESQDYQTYRAEIVDQNGNVIYRSGKLKPRNSRVFAFVPSKNLKRGDYLLKLYGFNPSGEEESAADFQFRVNLK